MLKVLINEPAPPRLAKNLHPGRLIKLLRAEKTGPYNPVPPKEHILAFERKVASGGVTYYTLRDQLSQGTYTVKEPAEFAAVSRTEKQKHQEAMKVQVIKNGIRRKAGCSGTDPEVFVVNAEGEVIPAFAFLPEKKKALDFTTHYGSGHAFWDGFQAEFDVAPFECHANGADDIRRGLQVILTAARNVDKQARLAWKSVMEIPEVVMVTTPAEHLLLGCAPSKNAYFEGVNPRLNGLVPAELNIRFAGCHIHLGIPDRSESVYQRMVKLLDKTVGVISVCLFRDMEDPRRRLYYGLAGEYRLPRHGLEYRVLSSAVLAHPVTYHLCFDLARTVGAMGADGLDCLWECTDEEAQQAINDLNLPLAEEILKRNEKILDLLIGTNWGKGSVGFQKAHRLIKEGAQNCLDLTDMHEAWRLDGCWRAHSDGDYRTVSGFPLKKG